jgi:predicted permease
MLWARRFWLRLQTLFRRDQIAHRLDDEIQFHLEQQIGENIAAGMSREEACYAALRTFGNPTVLKEDTRDTWGWLRLEQMGQDLRYAFRTLRKSAGFTATAILTLALGIGANTAIFQLLDAVRLRSLPVRAPQSLALVQINGGNHGFGVSHYETQLTYPLWEQLRAHHEVFSGVIAWTSDGNLVRIGQGSQDRRARGLLVSGETFAVLGVPAIRGRLFTEEDDRPGCGLPGAVISYGFWQSEFGGSDSAIGSKILIEGYPVEVLGVTPPSFFGLEVGKNFDLALPFCSLTGFRPATDAFTRRDYFWLTVMGRLKPGSTIELASAQLAAVSPGILEATVPVGRSTESQNTYRAFRLAAYPSANGLSQLRKTYDTSLWLLLCITGLVLLIACANLTNLMLVRAGTREREMAVRLTCGASRWRLVRQLLTEGLLLATGGAFLGLYLARVFARSILWLLSTERNVLELDLTLDWRVLYFTVSIAVMTCLVFGLVPAFRSSRAEPGDALKSGNRGVTARLERFSFQRILVVSQIAVSLVLLVGALLFVRSFRNLTTFDPGFREKGILLAFIDLEPMHLADAEQYPAVIRDLLTQIRSLPQVESAATSTHVPLDGSSWTLGLQIDSREGWSKFTWVSPGYFETMQIALLTGRDFNDRDTQASPHVAIVNEAFTRRYLGGVSPIGKTFRSVVEPGYPSTEYEIVGVVRNTKYAGLREETPAESFGAASQFPAFGPWVSIFLRSSSPPSVVFSVLRAKLDGLNPKIRSDFSVFRKDIENQLVRERMMALLSGFFGALAGLLTTIGLYGVISYIVVTRRNEIGVRMALGASRGNIVGMVLQETVVLLALGTVVGVALALAATRGAGSLLFGLQPSDPLSLIGASVLLVAVALIASFLPARRASRVDPMVALRYE